jgi:hypothetical protein
MIYVFAGNYQQARQWAIFSRLTSEQWTYVNEPRQLRARSGGSFVFVGSFGTNGLLPSEVELVKMAKSRGMKEMTLNADGQP